MGQIQNIPIRGIERYKSDVNIEAGACQELINWRYKDDTLQVVEDKEIFAVIDDVYDGPLQKLYEHRVLDSLAFIGVFDTSVQYISAINSSTTGDDQTLISLDSGETVSNVSTLGNVLVIYTEDSDGNGYDRYWFNFDADASLPYQEIDLPPLPQINYQVSNEIYTDVPSSDTYAGAVGEYLKFIDEKQKQGKIEGALVFQAAYRLFDGSYLLASAPQLIKIGGEQDSYGYYLSIENDPSIPYWEFISVSLGAVNSQIYVDDLSNWKNIIRSLDIFVSKPQTRYIDVRKYIDSDDGFRETEAESDGFIKNNIESGGNFWEVAKQPEWEQKIVEQTAYYKIKEIDIFDVSTSDTYTIPLEDIHLITSNRILPNILPHEIIGKDSIVYNSRLHSGNITESLFDGFKQFKWGNSGVNASYDYALVVKVDTEEGEKTVVKEMTPEELSDGDIYLNTLISYPDSRARSMEIYQIDGSGNYVEAENWEEGTLHPNNLYIETDLSGIEFDLENAGDTNKRDVIEYQYEEDTTDNGEYDTVLTSWTELDEYEERYNIPQDYDGPTSDGDYKLSLRSSHWKGVVYYTISGGEVTWQSSATSTSPLSPIETKDQSQFYFNLSPHPYYNLAYFVYRKLDTDTVFNENDFTGDTKDVTENKLLYQNNNKVYVSRLGNPFVFEPDNVYSIGSPDINKILALGFATESFDIGQFGQFPLYIFTASGIWTLSQGEQVLYAYAHPISKETLVNEDGVTSVHGGIAFITNRGLKISFGKEIKEVSQPLEGKPAPYLIENTFYEDNTSDQYLAETYPHVDMVNFIDYSRNAILGYDYNKKEIYVSNPSYSYTYVFNINYGQWYKIDKSFSFFTNTFPDYLATEGKILYNITRDDSYQKYKDALIQTRPLNVDQMRTYLNQSIARGEFNFKDDTKIGFYLFASQDCKDWKFIRGTQIDSESYEVYVTEDGEYVTEDGERIVDSYYHYLSDILVKQSHVSFKYFIFVIAGKLKESYLSHIQINYDNLYTSRLRT